MSWSYRSFIDYGIPKVGVWERNRQTLCVQGTWLWRRPGFCLDQWL